VRSTHPEAFDIGKPGAIHASSSSKCRRVAIGALTFTGSVISFLKLRPRRAVRRLILPGRHNQILLALALVFFTSSGPVRQRASTSG